MSRVGRILSYAVGALTGRAQPALGANQHRLGELTVEHVTTFNALLNTFSKTYSFRYDEAMRVDPQFALKLAREPYLRALLQERFMPLTRWKWHLVPEDPRHKAQQERAKWYEKVLRKTPRFSKQQLYLGRGAGWYGRYGSQVRLGTTKVEGRPAQFVAEHYPVNGDKIVFQWDGTPGVRINQQAVSQYPKADVVYDDRGGPILILRDPAFRGQFVLHTHEMEDADYFEPEMGGRVHGIGLRDFSYYGAYLRQEMIKWATSFMEKVGTLGLLCIYYPEGNDGARRQAEATAKEASNRNALAIPLPKGADKKTAGMELIPANMTGVQFLVDIISGWWERHIERLFVGQSMSAGADGENGMGGTGRANFAKDTKFNLLQFDARGEEETYTSDMIPLLTEANGDPGWGLSFEYVLPDPEAESKLDAITKAASLPGKKLSYKADEVRELVGMSAPGPEDEIVGGQDQPPPGAPVPGQPPGSPPAPGAPGQRAAPGGTPSPQGAAPDAPPPQAPSVPASPPPAVPAAGATTPAAAGAQQQQGATLGEAGAPLVGALLTALERGDTESASALAELADDPEGLADLLADLESGADQPHPESAAVLLALATAAEEGDGDTFDAVAELATDPDALADLLAEIDGPQPDPAALAAYSAYLRTVPYAWVAGTAKRSGKTIAIGNAEHAGKKLYGARAEAALRNQQRAQQVGPAAPTKRQRQQSDRDTARRLKSEAAAERQQVGRAAFERALAAKGDATPADLSAVAEWMRGLKRDALKAVAREVKRQVGGAKAKLAERVLDHLRGGAYKPESGPRRRGLSDSVAAQVVGSGGIDPTDSEFLKHYGSMREAVQNGIPMSVFRKGGGGLDALAEELHEAGVIRVPDGADAGEHLLEQLRNRALARGAASEGDQYDRAYEERAKQLADADQGGDTSAPIDWNSRRIEWDDDVPFAARGHVVPYSWTAGRSRSGGLVAIGAAEHEGQRLYGKRAEAALRGKQQAAPQQNADAQADAQADSQPGGASGETVAQRAARNWLADPTSITGAQLGSLKFFLEQLKKPELQALARQYRKQIGGTKAEIADRLYTYARLKRWHAGAADFGRGDFPGTGRAASRAEAAARVKAAAESPRAKAAAEAVHQAKAAYQAAAFRAHDSSRAAFRARWDLITAARTALKAVGRDTNALTLDSALWESDPALAALLPERQRARDLRDASGRDDDAERAAQRDVLESLKRALAPPTPQRIRSEYPANEEAYPRGFKTIQDGDREKAEAVYSVATDFVQSVCTGIDGARIAFGTDAGGRAWSAAKGVHYTQGECDYVALISYVPEADGAFGQIFTAVHELGHVIEFKKPGAKDLCRDFLAHRCGDEPFVPLNSALGTTVYRADEQGRKDEFAKALGERAAWYAGKSYGNDGSEILSLGLEKLYEAPARFAEADPEFFGLICHILTM